MAEDYLANDPAHVDLRRDQHPRECPGCVGFLERCGAASTSTTPATKAAESKKPEKRNAPEDNADGPTKARRAL